MNTKEYRPITDVAFRPFSENDAGTTRRTDEAGGIGPLGYDDHRRPRAVSRHPYLSVPRHRERRRATIRPAPRRVRRFRGRPGQDALEWDEQPGDAQHISFGNIAENDHVSQFPLDHPTRTRIRSQGRAEMHGAEVGPTERVLRFRLEPWDRNCKKHIPELWPLEAVREATAKLVAEIETRGARIGALEAELLTLERPQERPLV